MFITDNTLAYNKNGSLIQFVFRNPQNRPYVVFSIIAIITQISIYKYFYPYASFIMGDSYCYVGQAALNSQIDTYPIGYPMFLRFFSAINSSDDVLVIFQYLLLQCSALGFIFTIFYFINLHKFSKVAIVVITVLNPIFLPLANTISSDNFFLSLSLIWITLLIWIIYLPTLKLVVFHILILFFAFIVRYNALFYPFITIIGFLFSKEKLRIKVVGLLLGFIMIISFINYNRQKYYEFCGRKIFTPFSGWLTANNALYAYRYVPNEDHLKVPEKFKKLDDEVRIFFDTARNPIRHPENYILAYHDYMWLERSPLHVYFLNNYRKDSTIKFNAAWSAISPLYKEYGSWLIAHYPIKFAKYVLLPNLFRWFLPPIEFLEKYNSGLSYVPETIKEWFKYKDNNVKVNIKEPNFFQYAQNLYIKLVCIINFSFFLVSISLVFFKIPQFLKPIFIILIVCYLTNLFFSVYASPIALRFQMFPIQISTILSFVIIDFIFKNLSIQ
jgi:hypothetical protein